MARLVGSLMFVVMSSPTLAAATSEDYLTNWIILTLVLPLLYGLPSVGLGFCLQGLFRLRNAVIFLATPTLAFFAWLMTAHGLAKTLSGLPGFAGMLLVFAPLFAWGWSIGVKDAERATRRMLGETRN